MNTKKISIGILLLLSIATLFYFFTNTTEEFDENMALSEYPSSAVMIPPENFEEIDERADVIIRVQPVVILEYGEFTNGDVTSTITEVEITEVFRGEFETEDTIQVAEPYRVENSEVEPVGNYVPMEIGEEYILFLGATGSNAYRINFGTYGSYNASKEVRLQAYDEFETVGQLQELDFYTSNEEVLESYQTIRESVLEQYD